jgi:hypothetical protein
MKKLWILLVVLAVLGAAPLFADVTFSGEFMGFGSTDFDTMSGAFPKVELNGVAEIDDFNTLKFELDSEGAGFNAVALDDIRLITDFGAALGLPVGLKLTVGYFDTYFTDWYYYESSGWAFYYDWPNGLINQGPDANGAMQLDIAAGPVNIHWYNDGAGTDFMVGADVAFAGLTAWLAYGSQFGAIGDGTFSIEAAYNLMDMLDIGAFFRYGLGGNFYGLGDTAAGGEFSLGANLGADFGMFHAAAGLEGDSITDGFLDNIVVEATVAPVEGAKIALVAYMDLGGEAFNALDISAAYKVGAANFILGYMYVPDTFVAAPVYFSGDNYSADGLYLGVDVDY